MAMKIFTREEEDEMRSLSLEIRRRRVEIEEEEGAELLADRVAKGGLVFILGLATLVTVNESGLYDSTKSGAAKLYRNLVSYNLSQLLQERNKEVNTENKYLDCIRPLERELGDKVQRAQRSYFTLIREEMLTQVRRHVADYTQKANECRVKAYQNRIL